MRQWSKPFSTLLIGFSVWLFCVFVYLSHVPFNYTYDGMVFASRVERDTTTLWDMFHPHHLIYTFLGRLVFLFGKTHGANWDGLVALQFFDLATGSLGVLIAYHLLVRETGDRIIAALSALGLAFTFSYWYFSTSPGVRVFATVTPLFAWYVLTYQKNSRPLFGIWIGLAHALAVLGHQTNILLMPAFIGGIWLLKEKTAWEKTKITLYYLVALTVGVLAVYGFVGRFACYRITYSSWLWWVFSYFHVQQWGGHLQQAGINESGFAMVHAFLQDKKDLTQTMVAPFTYETAQTLFTYVLWGLAGAFILRAQAIWTNQRQLLWVGFFWLLAFVPFFIWWEPWNIEFWVSSTAPCWILMGLIVSSLSKTFSQPILHFANRLIVTGLWLGVISLLFFYNFPGVLQTVETPAAELKLENKQPTHGHQDLLNALDWKVKTHDLLILTGINTIPLYIDRYKKRDYLNLHYFLKKYLPKKDDKDAADKKTIEEVYVGKPAPVLDPWGDLTKLIKGQWKHHHKVWVLAEAVDEKDEWRIKFESMMGLPYGQLTEYFNNFDLKPIVYHGQVYFYEVSPSKDPSPEATETFALPKSNHVVGLNP